MSQTEVQKVEETKPEIKQTPASRRNYIKSYEEAKKEELVSLGKSKQPYNQILKYLKNEINKSTEMINFNYEIECFLEDGAYQLHKAVEELTGVAQSKGDEKPSGGKENVEMLDVQLSDGSRVKVPYGTIALSEMGPGAQITIQYNQNSCKLLISGACEFRFQALMDNIIDRTKLLLNTDSIYKYQAFQLEGNMKPQYLNLDNIEKEFMILSETVKQKLKPLLARVEKPEVCIQRGIPLKYGALLSGPYGTGKTLLAFKIAKKAISNKWTFIYLKTPSLLAQTLKLSKTLDKNGHGVIVFVEDIDQVVRGDRNAQMQDILNTLDGGDTKQMNVIALFTTNHIELIEPTFLRGKRIGTIIPMEYLDASTTKLFLQSTFAENYTLEQEGLDELCDYIATKGIAPAFMAEITETVKTNMVFEDSNDIKVEYIKLSVEDYLYQVGLSATKDTKETPQAKLANAFTEVFFKSPAAVEYSESVVAKVVDNI